LEQPDKVLSFLGKCPIALREVPEMKPCRWDLWITLLLLSPPSPLQERATL
jgi:hypothetical protein